ncbi:ABC transporter substrate-binding protein [Azospirillum sp. sgz301742]
MKKGVLSAVLMAGLSAVALASHAHAATLSNNGVKIGVLTDLSGTYSAIAGQGSVVAAQMAVEDFGGKIDGKPIEVLSADHQNKPDIASAVARKWIDTDGVDVLVDLVTSSVGLAVQQLAAERGVPTINTGAGTTALTGANCTATGIHWAYDNYALAKGTGTATVKNGGDTWYFLTADYAFGRDLEATTSQFVKAGGGKVLGSVRHPFPSSDFSSFLLQAQGSGAKVIGLANAGADTTNAIKQAKEFGITQAGQSLAGLLIFISDVHALGLETAQGLSLTTGYYWDMDDESRAFAKRFAERNGGAKPTMVQAGTYSAVLHYLKAVQAAATDEGKTVVAKMRELPIKDFFARNGRLREDNRMVHDMYLVQVKKPAESKGPWDYYTIKTVIPAEEAYRPLAESECPLVKK